LVSQGPARLSTALNPSNQNSIGYFKSPLNLPQISIERAFINFNFYFSLNQHLHILIRWSTSIHSDENPENFDPQNVNEQWFWACRLSKALYLELHTTNEKFVQFPRKWNFCNILNIHETNSMIYKPNEFKFKINLLSVNDK
jgi:hypothetical protein